MPIPNTLSKKKKVYFKTNICRHLKKPDTDNLQKLYLDCMQDIFFNNDSAVSIKSAIKIYSETPKTVINIIYRDDVLTKEDIIHYEV